MSDAPTPRTDAKAEEQELYERLRSAREALPKHSTRPEMVPAEFARELERESNARLQQVGEILLWATEREQKLERELAEARREWQPIETAPKGRKAIIAFRADILCTFCAYWNGDRKVWEHFGGSINEPVGGEITHWMPLPPNP